MRAYAGIIRSGEAAVAEPIPEAWTAALQQHWQARSLRIVQAPGAVFVGETAALLPLSPSPAAGTPAGALLDPATDSSSDSSATGDWLLLDLRFDVAPVVAADAQAPADADAMAGDAANLLSVEAEDRELARRSWLAHGAEAATRWRGEFAVAHWRPLTRELWLLRDPLGLRSLYYYQTSTLFAFATELPALLALPFVPHKLRVATLADVLCGNPLQPADATYYEALHTVPAGQRLYSRAGQRCEAQAYWQPPAIVARGRHDEAAIAEAAAALRGQLIAAVECRLRGGRRVAVHLSGGLDSSAVACIAARRLKQDGRRLLALCSALPEAYGGPETDERAHVEAVLAQEDNIDVVWVTPALDADPFAALPRWFKVLAQPAFSNVSHIEELLGEAGRAHGVDIVLSGFGGDFFASWHGSGWIHAQLQSGYWRLALRELQALHRQQGQSWAQLLRREVLAPALPARLRQWRQSAPQRHCLRSEFAAGRRAATPALATLSPAELMRFVLAPGRLERTTGGLVQVFAQEFAQSLRFPLLDQRLVEFICARPLAQLQFGGWPRALFRRALQGILPESIRWRRDKGGAFDPALMSRLVARREALVAWAQATGDHLCWRYVDREQFLKTLALVEPAGRAHWRPDAFRVLMTGGAVAHFIDWHARNEAGEGIP